jgi:hypothetical protein
MDDLDSLRDYYRDGVKHLNALLAERDRYRRTLELIRDGEHDEVAHRNIAGEALGE